MFRFVGVCTLGPLVWAYDVGDELFGRAEAVWLAWCCFPHILRPPGGVRFGCPIPFPTQRYEVAPFRLGFCKAASAAHDSDDDWLRCTEHHVCSTAGLLWWLVHSAARGRPIEARQDYASNLQKFLDHFLDSQSFGLPLDFDPRSVASAGAPPTGPAVHEVSLDDCLINMGTVVEHADPASRAALVEAVSPAVSSAGAWTLHASTVLVSLFRRGCLSMFRNMLFLVAMALEHGFMGQDLSENPLDGRIDNRGGRKWHGPVKDALALGRGPSGSGDPAAHPEQHVRTFSVFHGARRGVKRTSQCVDVGRRLGFIMRRYQSVGQKFYEQCSAIATSADASRAGGQDLMCGVLVGKSGADILAAWAPPMVAFWVLF